MCQLGLSKESDLNIMCEDHVIALNNGATNFESCDDRVNLTLRHNRYKKLSNEWVYQTKKFGMCINQFKDLAPLGTKNPKNKQTKNKQTKTNKKQTNKQNNTNAMFTF